MALLLEVLQKSEKTYAIGRGFYGFCFYISFRVSFHQKLFFDGVVVFVGVAGFGIAAVVTVVAVAVAAVLAVAIATVTVTAVLAITAIAIVVAVLLLRHVNTIQNDACVGELLLFHQRVEETDI